MTTSMRRLRSLLALVLTLGIGARAAHAQALYWLDTNEVTPTLNKSDPNGFGVKTIALAPGSLPEGLAILASTGKLYWAEAAWTNANIERTAPTLGGVVSPVVTGGSVLRGIAVDDTTRQLYWTTSNLATGATLYRANADGTGVTTLPFVGPLTNPRGIAVDHNALKLYWTDFDQSAIYRSNLDGTVPVVWLTLPPGSNPYGIAIDPVAGWVFWTEYGTGLLRRSSTSVPAPLTVQVGLANPTYVTLDRATATVYWIDGGAGSQHIKRSPYTGEPVLILPPPITTYGGLAFASNGITETPPAIPPTELAFERAWPTPSHGTVHFAFALPRAAHARLAVLDLQGREVAVLTDDTLPPGRYEREWDARAGATPASAGVYFARLTVEGRHFVQRLALVP